jgi:hypothetical protein
METPLVDGAARGCSHPSMLPVRVERVAQAGAQELDRQHAARYLRAKRQTALSSVGSSWARSLASAQ